MQREHTCHSKLGVNSKGLRQGEVFKGKNNEDYIRCFEAFQSLYSMINNQGDISVRLNRVTGQMSLWNYFLYKAVVASLYCCGSGRVFCKSFYEAITCKNTSIIIPWLYLFLLVLT